MLSLCLKISCAVPKIEKNVDNPNLFETLVQILSFLCLHSRIIISFGGRREGNVYVTIFKFAIMMKFDNFDRNLKLEIVI